MALLRLHGIPMSIGSVGDALDNALAETIIGCYKTELIRNPVFAPWKSFEQLNLETANWVYWRNNKNITEYNNWLTPIEVEKMYYNQVVDIPKKEVLRVSA